MQWIRSRCVTTLTTATYHTLQEFEFLTSSISQLKVAQTKYVDAKDSLNVLNKNNKGELTFHDSLSFQVFNRVTRNIRKETYRAQQWSLIWYDK